MGRRSKAERWRPREVHAMVTPEDRARAEADRLARLKPDYTPPLPHARRTTLLGSGLINNCVHGNPWTTCTLCGPIKVQR